MPLRRMASFFALSPVLPAMPMVQKTVVTIASVENKHAIYPFLLFY